MLRAKRLNALLLTLLLVVLASCATPYDTVPSPMPENIEGMGVLVFTKIAGFRHPSIKVGAEAIQELGSTNNWTVVQTDNGAAFSPDYLSHFDVVVWLSTTWDVLSPEQEKAFESYIENGGGYVGIHAAADTEYDWPWYGETLVGTWFKDHPVFPNVRAADVIIEDTTHAATKDLPVRWNYTDEWYNFKKSPREVSGIQVLASLDETSYDAGPGAMGDHPIIWCRSLGQGRAIYSGLGHTPASFTDPLYLQHLTGAINWAGGLID